MFEALDVTELVSEYLESVANYVGLRKNPKNKSLGKSPLEKAFDKLLSEAANRISVENRTTEAELAWVVDLLMSRWKVFNGRVKFNKSADLPVLVMSLSTIERKIGEKLPQAYRAWQACKRKRDARPIPIRMLVSQ